MSFEKKMEDVSSASTFPTPRSIPQSAENVTVVSQTQFTSTQSESSSVVSTAPTFAGHSKLSFSVPSHDPIASLDALSGAASQHAAVANRATSHSSYLPTASSASISTSNQRSQSGISQVLAAGLVTNASQMTHSSQMPSQQQQHQFQKLKVEDALSYLDQVKYQFGNQPQVYNDFLDIMKEFKSQSIDTPGVIARVSHLFNGHPDLIVGFNTFLPPGYKIEVSANDQVSVTGPNMISQTIHPIGARIEPGQSATTIQVHTPHGKFATTLPQLPVRRSSPTPPQGGGVQALSSAVFSSQQRANAAPTSSASGPGPNTNTAAHLGNALIGQSQGTGAGGQPVEFNHAINYVNKIKNRFQGQADIYKAFLEILHKYQKEQKSVKDSNGSYTPSLSESEVYAQVARLFQNDEDLLREFGQFLPDAGGAVGAGIPPLFPHSGGHSGASLSSVKLESVSKELSSAAKKVSGPSNAKQSRSSSHQSSKRVAQSSSHPTGTKRVKSSSLKDVSLAEASKHGTLSEFAFFDKVRKVLRSQEAYENFLRCLLLYNNEVIGRSELVQLVQPFLVKFTELFNWFKHFLGHKDSHTTEMENETIIPQQQIPQEKHEGMAMEIDYTTLKRLGSSYRALPSSFQQPCCTGRDSLCKEVLNDTWVSFPSWSEDSQFVTSKKTQFEEHIYRCEDERFELDVVIETNLGAIRSFEAINKKLLRMSEEDKLKFRLDNYLGGSSEITQRKAIHRIYGDKASDIVEGLKKNPSVAVPLVLKRLKMKDTEWREAQHQFNKTWRTQNEKYYLKSLDHQGISFKGNDIRHLRSKSLLNEIETIYDERQEAVENGGSVVTGPHILMTYEDKSIMDDAASLIIHHVKRQSGIHKDDKQKVRQVIYQILPDLYFSPRGNQPSDDDDEDEDDSDQEEVEKKTVNGNRETKSGGYLATDNVEGQCHIFFGNGNFYLFFRLHYILCERLLKIYRISESLTEEETREKKERKEETVADMLRLRKINDIEIEDYYTSFLDQVRNLLDGNVDCSQYEDTLREMFTIHAYTTFTMDRLVQNIVRQLQHIVQDEACIHLLDLYQSEEVNNATGGSIVSQHRRASVEAAYQSKAEHLASSENCYKIMICQKQGQLQVGAELLDTEEENNLDLMEVAKWSEYLEQYANSEDVDMTSYMKERISENPVFLQRNANVLRRAHKNDDATRLFVHNNIELKVKPSSYKLRYVPNTEDISYRARCFFNARSAQNEIAEKLHNKFRAWLVKWEQENVTRDMGRQINNWLLGKTSGMSNVTTTLTVNHSKRLPRNIYKVTSADDDTVV